MAAKRWLGIVQAVSQVTTLTVGGTIVIGDVFTIVCGNATVTVTAAATTATSVATLIQAALSSSTAPGEFADATWTVLGSVVTGTGTPGVPFVVSSSATASATCVSATPTACTGPNFADVAGNWSGVSLPTTGDTITIEANAPSILWGMTSNTDLIAKMTIESGFSNQIGLPEVHARGFREYRQQWLSMNLTAVEVGVGAQTTSQIVKLDLKATATAVTVFKTGSTSNDTERPLQLIGGSSATATVESGVVDFASRATDSAGFTSIVVGSQARVFCGLTCTHTTVTTLGTTYLENSATNLNVKGGSTITTGQVTNLDIISGQLTYKSASTITAATVGPGTLINGDLRAKTITALSMRQKGKLVDPQKMFTITALTLATGVQGITAD